MAIAIATLVFDFPAGTDGSGAVRFIQTWQIGPASAILAMALKEWLLDNGAMTILFIGLLLLWWLRIPILLLSGIAGLRALRRGEAATAARWRRAARLVFLSTLAASVLGLVFASVAELSFAIFLAGALALPSGMAIVGLLLSK